MIESIMFFGQRIANGSDYNLSHVFNQEILAASC